MTAIKQIIASGLVLGLVALVGVMAYRDRGPSIDLTGKWIGFRDLPTPPGSDRVLIRNLAKVEVRIGKNGKFVLFERGLPKTGNVRYSEGKAILDIDEVAGRTLERQPEEIRSQYGPVELTVKGKSELVYRDPKLQEQPVILKRESQPPR